MLTVLFFIGALTCDADSNGRVSIEELVQGVRAALESPEEVCGFGCTDSNLCPEACTEFPEALLDGTLVSCSTSLCDYSYDQKAQCLRLLRLSHPQACVELK